MFNNFFFGTPAVYEIRWKNIVELGTPYMTLRRMRNARWIPKATNTYSEYVLFPPLQQWLRESALILLCRYSACLVHNMFATSCIDVTIPL